MRRLFWVCCSLSLCAAPALGRGMGCGTFPTLSAAKHTLMSEKSAKCVQGCVKGGTAPVFVSGDKALKIDDASKSKVMEHLGHKVTINGSLEGDTVTIEDIKMAE